MRVLLISHTVLSKTGNMGKTLSGYLEQLRNGEIAQIYIHSEVPTDDRICRNYYRFTDFDALKSVVMRWHRGSIFSHEDIAVDRATTRVDKGTAEALYVAGSKRRPGMMTIREIVWLLSNWKNRHLERWMKEFNPDVVFYAAGDYMFTYQIARWASKKLGKPLVVVCTDDYYCHNRNSESILGRCLHWCYMKVVRATMKEAKLLFTICENMAREYERLFQIPCCVLHTGVNTKNVLLQPAGKQISYLGNTGFERYRQLLDIGAVLHSINPDLYIDVYSGSKHVDAIEAMKDAPGIRFHGAVSAEEVLQVMERSLAVIHTESFQEQMQHMVRFSVSTKIAESMMYGPCMIAYGPEGIASIDYLKEHRAAWVITSRERLEAELREFLENESRREEILGNARRLARRNHDIHRNSRLVYDSLREICGE